MDSNNDAQTSLLSQKAIKTEMVEKMALDLEDTISEEVVPPVPTPMHHISTHNTMENGDHQDYELDQKYIRDDNDEDEVEGHHEPEPPGNEVEGNEEHSSRTEMGIHRNRRYPQARSHSPSDEDFCTLWMGDLNPDWDQDFIKEAFGDHRKDITVVKLVNDKQGNKATYCFVEFTSEATARNAVLGVNGKKIPNDEKGGGHFNLSFANSPNQTYLEYNLFVSNLHPDLTDIKLFNYFLKEYKSCRGAKIYEEASKGGGGYSKQRSGFIRFTNETDQQQAMIQMNKKELKGYEGYELLLELARPRPRGGPRGVRGGGRGGGHDAGPFSGGFHQQQGLANQFRGAPMVSASRRGQHFRGGGPGLFGMGIGVGGDPFQQQPQYFVQSPQGGFVPVQPPPGIGLVGRGGGAAGGPYNNTLAGPSKIQPFYQPMGTVGGVPQPQMIPAGSGPDSYLPRPFGSVGGYGRHHSDYHGGGGGYRGSYGRGRGHHFYNHDRYHGSGHHRHYEYIGDRGDRRRNFSQMMCQSLPPMNLGSGAMDHQQLALPGATAASMNPATVLVSIPPMLEGVEPLSPEEHNYLTIWNNQNQWHYPLEACHWSAISFPTDARRGEMRQQLNLVSYETNNGAAMTFN